MAHNIQYATYPENVNKKSVQAEWDDYAAHEDWQEGCSGLPGSIRWIDEVVEDYEAAMNYIETHDKGWYDQLAVKFYDYSSITPSKKLVELRERLKEKRVDLTTRSNQFHFSNHTSTTVGCKNCGSKLALKYLKANVCPLCKTDLRPPSTLQALERLSKSVKELEKQVKEEEKKFFAKQKKQAKIKWLVKIEYHT